MAQISSQMIEQVRATVSRTRDASRGVLLPIEGMGGHYALVGEERQIDGFDLLFVVEVDGIPIHIYLRR